MAAGLVINAEKYLFNVPSIKFLGHEVAAGGITPLPHRVVALQQHPRPGTIKELQGFPRNSEFLSPVLPASSSR